MTLEFARTLVRADEVNGRLAQSRLPRLLHPGAWWLWALGLAIAASRTTNPILLGLILAVAALVVAARKPVAPWSRSFSVFLKLGLLVIAIRLVFQVILGTPIGTHVIVTLPQVPLPNWLAALRLGGQITLESVVFAASDGFRLAVLLACVGAANSLASPSRLLKALPAGLYEVGVAVVVAMTFAPQLVADLSRVRQARLLRGKPDRGIRSVAGSMMPVFEGALDRAIVLAAAMDSRGYGRTAAVPARVRRMTAALVIGGLIGICIGLFGVLDAGGLGSLGLLLLAIGLIAGVVGLWLGGKRAIRTRYRPDPWRLAEWIVSASGIAAAAGMFYLGGHDPQALQLSVTPFTVPAFPFVAVLGIAAAMLPAVVAPLPPSPNARSAHEATMRASDNGVSGKVIA